MWTSDDFKSKKQKYDMRSSAQGIKKMTALQIDGEEFINMTENVVLSDNHTFQTQICRGCGFAWCMPHNWIALRRVRGMIFLTPAFEQLIADPREYDPPQMIKTRGSLCLNKEQYAHFRQFIPGLISFNRIRKLSVTDLISLYKWEAPGRLFGTLPELGPTDKKRMKNVSLYDTDTVAGLIKSVIDELSKAQKWRIRPLTEKHECISIDIKGKPVHKWKALYKAKDKWGLILGEQFIIEIIS